MLIVCCSLTFFTSWPCSIIPTPLLRSSLCIFQCIWFPRTLFLHPQGRMKMLQSKKSENRFSHKPIREIGTNVRQNSASYRFSPTMEQLKPDLVLCACVGRDSSETSARPWCRHWSSTWRLDTHEPSKPILGLCMAFSCPRLSNPKQRASCLAHWSKWRTVPLFVPPTSLSRLTPFGEGAEGQRRDPSNVCEIESSSACDL